MAAISSGWSMISRCRRSGMCRSCSTAKRFITDQNANSPYSGYFRPENVVDLTAFNGLTGANLNGVWTLIITDYRNNNTGTLDNWSLHLNSGLTVSGTEQTIARSNDVIAPGRGDTQGRFNFNGPLNTPTELRPPSSPDIGITPGVALASDNTLGSFSPYEGRLY